MPDLKERPTRARAIIILASCGVVGGWVGVLWVVVWCGCCCYVVVYVAVLFLIRGAY